MFEIGKYLKEKYKSFYPQNNSKAAHLQSSDVDRCLDSIAVISKVLWPPQEGPNWFQPRIFTIPQPLDTVNIFNYILHFVIQNVILMHF